MEDNNLLNGNENIENGIESAAESGIENNIENDVEIGVETAAESQSSDALNEELEQIAETFRKELKKAQSDLTSDENAVEDGCENADSTEGDADENGGGDDCTENGEISEEDLCVRCGKAPRDKEYGENYEYCGECREKMRHIRISFADVLVAVLLIATAVLSVLAFSKDFAGYYSVYKAKTYKNENMLDSAINSYDEAISYFENKNVNAKRLYLESAELIFKTMPEGTASMGEVSDRIAKALEGGAYKCPVFKNSLKLRSESLTLYGTMEQFYNLVNSNEYANYSIGNEEMYNSVMKKIEALVGTQLSIKSIDGKTEETVTVNEGAVRFCQYMFAYTSGKFDEADTYLEKVAELEPDYLWIYAYEMCSIHIENGEYEKAETVAQAILDNNKEESDGYAVYSTVARLKGDSKKAIEWADKGLKFTPADAELLRVKSMACVADGDIENAEKVIDEALQNNAYGLLYFTAIVIKNEAGDSETVNELLTALENGGLSLTDKMNDYLSGKITAQQMFTEGSGDVE